MDLSALLDAITVLVVAAVGAVAAWLKGTTVDAAKAAAEAGAKSGAELAIKNINWPTELRQELEKTRGTERQEKRFEAYAQLWKQQRPLAIYDETRLDTKAAASLSSSLSDWYFSDTGGLMLTAHVRDFYFALQDLLRGVASRPGWQAERSGRDPDQTFRTVLNDAGAKDALSTLDYLDTFEGSAAEALVDWPGNAPAHAKKWRADMGKLLEVWAGLDPRQRFAALQQVSSTLRTAMVFDVESRLR
jgi:hypothetical protein